METDTTQQDPEFGLIRFDGSDWILEQSVLFNGAEIPVKIKILRLFRRYSVRR